MYNKYLDEIATGKRIAGKRLRQAVDRHLNDIEKSKSDDYPYYFSEEWADKYIKFIKLIRLQEGELNHHFFPIQPFQSFIIALTFGWRKKENDLRRFNDTLFLMAKKNAKTTLAAAMAVAEMYLEGEGGGQYLFAATTREQANLCFNFAKLMVEDMMNDYRVIKNKTEVWKNSIIRKDLNCVMKSVSKEAKNLEGKGASVAVLDEFHLIEKAEIVANLRTGMAGRRQPLFIRISTEGYGHDNPFTKFVDYCKKILDGTAEADNILVIILEIDEEDDWKDEKNWYKSNPNLPTSPTLSFLRTQFGEARDLGGASEVAFKIKHLNQRVNSEVTWISAEAWAACGTDEFPPLIKNGNIIGFAGLDLAYVRDFCAYVEIYPDDDKIYVNANYYLPEATVRRTKNQSIKLWASKGLINVTPGEATDYNYIYQDIIEHNRFNNIKLCYYDQFNSSQLVTELEHAGVKMGKFGQSPLWMNVPVMTLEKLVVDKKIVHNNDPILAWMVSNARRVEDRNRNKKVTKGNATGNIDAVVALLMAIGAWVNDGKSKQANPMIYNLSKINKK